MNVGKAIKYYRNKQNLTQRELADKINVSERTIGHYETGTRLPNLEMLESIAKALNIQASEFLKPLPKEKKEVVYKKTWLLTFDEITGFTLTEELPKNTIGQFVFATTEDEIFYLPTEYVTRILQNKSEVTGEMLDTGKKVKDGYFVNLTNHAGLEQYVHVESVIEVRNDIFTHEDFENMKKREKEKEELIQKLNLYALHLSIDCARIDSKTLAELSNFIKELSNMFKGNYSKKILTTIIDAIYDTYESITEDEKEKLIEMYPKKIADAKLILTDEEFEKFYSPTLDDMLELVKKVEVYIKKEAA